jgi:hypothetical protein
LGDQVFVVVKGDDEMQRMARVWERFNNLRASIDNICSGDAPAQPSVLPCGACLLTCAKAKPYFAPRVAVDLTSIPFQTKEQLRS